jgi:hypothetical protein
MTTESWDITDDSELKEAVRAETQYDDSKISPSDLSDLVASAKRELALKAGVSSFYDDRGITVALQGVVMAKGKGAVENSPVVTKNLAGQDVTFRSSDGSSLQLSQYERMVEEALTNSGVEDAGAHGIEITSTYMQG